MKYQIINRPIDENWVPYKELSTDEKQLLKKEIDHKLKQERNAKLYDAMAYIRDCKE